MSAHDIPDQNAATGIFPAAGELAAPNVRNWASEIDEATVRQAARTGRLPILAGPVALMPDAHLGYGCAVGSVIATAGAVVPSAVGVDIGCGMSAAMTDLSADDLPDSLDPLLDRIVGAVPAGVGRSHAESTRFADRWFSEHGYPDRADTKLRAKALTQFGTLGSGNHFAEVSLDEQGRVWVVLHSGSRGVGKELAEIHIKGAARSWGPHVGHGFSLEDPDLAWLVQGTADFDAYIADLRWAQQYAFGNRDAMFRSMCSELFEFAGRGRIVDVVRCHHNYCAEETHLVDGEVRDVWVTRKGAVSARAGERGIIPGSMGTDTFIVEGLGNEASWQSCSHGAGRRMSRNQAKKLLDIDEFVEQMRGRSWLAGESRRLLDEAPGAYKSIEAVMADQSDLVRPLHRLEAILNYKG